MSKEVKVPNIGENVEKGTVVSLMVSEGDTVEKDQALLELETDKAVVEIPSPASGKITSLKVKEGDEIEVGAVIALLDEDDASPGDSQQKEKDGSSSETQAAEMDEGKESPEEQASPKSKETRQNKAGDEGREEPEKRSGDLAPAAPSTRRFARELGVDINKVSGNGPGGRIREEDIRSYVRKAMENLETGREMVRTEKREVEMPDFSRFGPIRREPMSKIRSITAGTMSSAWKMSPMVTQFEKADITDVEDFRKTFNQRRKKDQPKLTVTAVMIKVCAEALKKFETVNAAVDIENNEMIFKEHIHIGVAVDTEHGLIVPVIRDAGEKGILQIARDLDDLAGRARNRKIKPDELQGGTFTISNLGGIGGTYFTPIVYPYQAAILGVGSAEMEPVYIEGEPVSRLRVPLALTYDHRIVDGADGARFIRWIAETLKQPLNVLMER